MLRRSCLVLAMLGFTCGWRALPAAPPTGEGWQPIFNGKDLNDWEPRNGTATYKVEDGCVVGTTSEGSPNSFMCSKRDYAPA